MSAPNLLVIHGVSHRDEGRFHEMITPVAEALGTAVGEGVLPVFWGGLAPPADLEFLSMPRREDDANTLGRGPEEVAGAIPTGYVAELLQMTGDLGNAEAASRELADRTLEVLRTRTGQGVATETSAIVREAIQEAAASGERLAVQSGIEEALAQVVMLAPPTGESGLEFAGLDLVRDGLKTVLSVFDREAGRLVGGAVEHVLRKQEAALSRAIAINLGDILSYEKEGNRMRGQLDAAYELAKSRGDPVDLLAHSLGALISVEWLLGATVERPNGAAPTPPDQRKIRTFVSFGTQVSLFSELHGLQGPAGLMIDDEPPSVLQADVGRWVNVWHQLDPLAFVMHRSLELSVNGSGLAVEDLRLELAGLPMSAADLSFHSSYWTDPRFLSWLADELA